MAKKDINIGKLVQLLTGDNRVAQIANIIDKVQIKDSEQIRPIVPIEQWCYDDYYIGRDGNEKLYTFWKDLLCDIFGNGKQNYTTVVLTGGIGCRPINDTLYETSEGLLHLNEIQELLNNDVKVYINTEKGIEQIVATHIIGEKETTTLTLNDGTIFTGSSDHLLKVFDGSSIVFKKLSDITKNDQIIKLEKDTILKDNKYTFLYVVYKVYSSNIVGDIEVEGSHTYISDGGLINHNTGKSTCGLYILLRKLYELSCYRNIAGLFGMMSNSFTAFLYFSLTKYQAERTGYGQLRSIIDGIPYFNECFCRNKYRNSTLDFPENVRMFYGASTGDMIGMNVIASILDEANFFGDSSGSDVNYGDVAKLHDSIMSRQSSRYTKNGVNHSLSVVISSSTFQSSYTQQLYERSLTDSSIKYARARLWDIKPKGTYSDKMFYVFAGNEKFDPFMIESTSDLCAKLGISLDPSLDIPDAISKLSQEYRNLVDEVPIDFYNIYKSNIIQGLQDFSGMSVSSTGKLFTSRSVFDSCIDKSIQPLFSKNEFIIETCNDEPYNCIQYYLNGIEFPHKECPRYLHIDIGVANDAYGIACCYKHGTKLVDGVEVPEYFFDFSLRIVPPPAPKRVSISRCHEFIKYMRDNLGLRIGLVSFDQFQSEASRQFLTENGFNVKYQSVDKTDTAYLFFVDCMYKNIVHFGEEFAEAIKKELFDLIWYRSKQKVDHPAGGTAHGATKDRMDAVVGSLYNAYITQETMYNPDDILSLSKYNSCDLDNYTELPVDDLDLDDNSQIKRISLDTLENPFLLRGDIDL
jgi:hypothetical protein